MKRFKERIFYLGLREIINYFYIGRRARNAQKNDPLWKKLDLRIDWVNRIYTIVNIKEEDVGESDLVKRAKVAELIKPKSIYVGNNLDLKEVVSTYIEQKTERSFLVVYIPIFNNFSVWYIIKTLLIIGALVLGSIWLII